MDLMPLHAFYNLRKCIGRQVNFDRVSTPFSSPTRQRPVRVTMTSCVWRASMTCLGGAMSASGLPRPQPSGASQPKAFAPVSGHRECRRSGQASNLGITRFALNRHSCNRVETAKACRSRRSARYKLYGKSHQQTIFLRWPVPLNIGANSF